MVNFLPPQEKEENKLLPWLGAACVYLVLLAFHGYIFGHNDQIEVLPYALFLEQPSLYPTDFYIQEISRFIPNERYLFSILLTPFVDYLPESVAAFHAIASLLLLVGLFKIGKLFIKSSLLVWLSILCLFVPFYYFNLGGNELYYNSFISSFLAKSILVWALYCFLKERIYIAFILMIPATLIHPVAGAQIFLLLLACGFIGKMLKLYHFDWMRISIALFAFAFTAGAWIFYLKMFMSQTSISNKLFFEIIEFRLPHHYLPSYFSVKSYALLIPLFLLAMIYYFGKSKMVFLFFMFSIVGLCIYTVGVEFLQSKTLLSSQWFKSTIWLEALAVFSVFAFFEEKIKFDFKDISDLISYGSLSVLALSSFLILANPVSIFKERPYDFFYKNERNDAVKIAQKIRKRCPKDALFLLPPDNTSFKYFSQRNAYVEYKSIVHREGVLKDWYQRIKTVYKIDIRHRRGGEDLSKLALYNYLNLKEGELIALKEEGLNYVLTTKSHLLDFPVILSEGNFQVYKISD